MLTKDMCPISVTLSQNWCLACQNFGHFCAILSTKGTNNTSVSEVMGGWGALAPPQFNKIRKFSVEVGNFEGGIETAMKNESPLRRKEFLF